MSKIFNNNNLLLAAGLGLGIMMWSSGVLAAEVRYSDNDKRMALNFISEELRLLGNDEGPAVDEYIDLQEDILAGEASSRAVRHLAASYQKRHPEEDTFARTFAPTSRMVFKRGQVWHAVDMAGDLKVAERCYTSKGVKTQCS